MSSPFADFRGGARAANESLLSLLWAAMLSPVLDNQDFVEGLLTGSCLAVVYGDSNTGKSFWAIDLGLHIASGRMWNGREVTQGIVIYIALEGGKMTQNRVITARKRLNLPTDIPFALVTDPIDLRTPMTDAERLVNTIRHAIIERAGPDMPVRLVIIDTMSRALNGGNEGAEDMSALLANVDHVRRETGVAILFVAHCGKDATKGIRGWSGVRAAIDVEIEVSRPDVGDGFVAQVTKERDLPSGDCFSFTLDVVDIGLDQRGKTVTTCVVQHTGLTDRPRRKVQRRALTNAHAAFRDLFENLMATHGGPIVPEPTMPIVSGMTREQLRQGLIRGGWFDEGQLSESGKLRRAAYSAENNALRALKKHDYLAFDRFYVWLI